MEKVKYEGVKVTLRGKEYIVPPLSFRGWQVQESLIRDFWKVKSEVLAAKEKGDEAGLIDAPFIMKYLPIVHSAIARNYPEVTADDLLDVLILNDIDGFNEALVAALNEGKEQKSAPGEARAVAS